MNATRSTCDALRRTLQTALGHIDLRERTRVALARMKIKGACFVACAGKASPAMSRGAVDALASQIESMLVVAPYDLALPRSTKSAIYMHASHPLPDVESVRAGNLALALATRAREERATLVVLISGGASSLLASPIEGVSLEKKRLIVNALLGAGASIAEINVVRRHLSRVKGGGLRRAANSARVVTVLASDVLDDATWDIGSGPSVLDPTTTADARRVLRRLGEVGRGVPLAESLKEDDRPEGEKRRPAKGRAPIVIASPSMFASELARVLRHEGFRARVLSPSDARVETLAREYVQIARQLKRGECVVRAAEPRVRVPCIHGDGGRASHLAALVACARGLPHDVAFLAAATDGVDGSSRSAGAIVSRASFAELDRELVRQGIARFDTAPLHARAKTAIFLGESSARKKSAEAGSHTGQNFADVHVLARAEAPHKAASRSGATSD